MTMTLNVAERTGADSASVARAAGKIPAVVYGPKQEPLSIVVDQREFEKLYRDASESTIITLTGLKEDIEVLVKDLDFNPAKGGVVHADFYAIERGKDMTTTVPLEFVGEAPVEDLGATVNKVLHEVTVTCRPSALPGHIEVDISALDSADAQITIADLPQIDGVTIDNEAEDVVATVSAARDVEAETAESEAPDMDAVAVEGEAKSENAEAVEEKKEE